MKGGMPLPPIVKVIQEAAHHDNAEPDGASGQPLIRMGSDVVVPALDEKFLL